MLRNAAPKIPPHIFPMPPFNDTPPITAAAIEFILMVLPIVGLPEHVLALIQIPATPAASPAKVCTKNRNAVTLIPDA